MNICIQNTNVARGEGEIVAKKVIRGANMLTLRASGGGIKDLHYSPDDIEIKGIAIGFQRLWRKQ